MKKTKNRRRRNGLVEIVNGALSLLVLGIVVVVGLFFYGAHTFYADGKLAEETQFQVQRGTGLSTIAGQLEDAGIVSNRWVFQFGTLTQKKERALKAGEYRIAKGSSMAEVLKELTEGTPITYSVTIPEGFTTWQVIERVNADSNLSGEITLQPAEGALLPDTYVYERGDERDSIIKRMQDAQTEALAEIWESRQPDLPVETPEELVILASIVEKETGIASERPEVAAVFINRLNFNMRLQSDPTTIYGITNGQGPLGRGLKRSELEAETPYNTYKVAGLPAGPIANPGIEAMRAVANPAESKSLYFVAAGANPSEGHLFAPSYDEHRKNVALYRKALKEAAAQEEAEAEAARDLLEAEAAAKAGQDTSASETAN